MYDEERETQDIMKNYYLIRRNLMISILFLIQHNCILSQRSSIKKHMTSVTQDALTHLDTNHPTPSTKSQYYKSQGINFFYYIHSIM